MTRKIFTSLHRRRWRWMIIYVVYCYCCCYYDDYYYDWLHQDGIIIRSSWLHVAPWAATTTITTRRTFVSVTATFLVSSSSFLPTILPSNNKTRSMTRTRYCSIPKQHHMAVDKFPVKSNRMTPQHVISTLRFFTNVSPSNKNHHHRIATATMSSMNDIDHQLPSSSDRPHNDVNNVSIVDDNNNTRWGISLSLGLTYLTVMFAKCALPAVLTLLSSSLLFPSDHSPQYYMSRLLLCSTLAIATGKLVLGPIIDTIGGIRSIQILLSLLMILLFIISSCHTFTLFAISWMGIDFIFSSGWAACMNAIYQTYEQPKQWTQQISILAASARTGNTIAFALFSMILRYYPTSWRPIFIISAIAQAAPLIMITYFNNRMKKQIHHTKPITMDHRDDNDRRHHLIQQDQSSSSSSWKARIRESLMILRYEMQQIEFWLHLLSRSMLMIYASFLLFVPTLFTNIYQTSSSYASQVGSLYALGCFLSITLLSPLYSRIQNHAMYKFFSYTILLFVGATGTSLLQLGHMMKLWTLSTFQSTISMIVWGISFSIPFYIPPSLYALQRGTASATIADVFDIGGFTLLALFNGYVAGISSKELLSSWIPTFQITTLCSFISYVSLSFTIYMERTKKRRK